MKVRIKFKKYGVMRFIGHLDIMRYFQKSMRRAEIDIAYTTGFSPHQIMSFASPLGVGLCSEGEYFDIELNSHHGSEQVKNDLNRVMVPGMEIVSVTALKDQSKNAMASVAAAQYDITLKEGHICKDILEKSESFFLQPTITVIKQTKKNEMEFDLKPHIYDYKVKDNGFYLFVDASSSGNIKPLLVIEALYHYCGEELGDNQFQVTRLDTFMYNEEGKEPLFIPLDEAGEKF